jgi:hypothetical protein
LDTLRSDAINSNSYKLWPQMYPGLQAPATPVLDDLAASGGFFLNTISAAPYTSASHASYFTGQYPLRHGVVEFYNGGLRSPSIFTYGRRAGRTTILKVDFPIILGPQLGFTADIDTYLVEQDQDFIDAVLAADSTVACAHFGGVHIPYGFHNLRFGGDAYRARVEGLEAELPANFPQPTDQITETFRDPEDEALLLRYKRALNYFYAERDYERLFGLYLEGIEFFLRERFEPFVTQLTERVRRSGKTMLLVVFADHGHEFGRDSYGNFNSLAEGVLRVPVIMIGDDVDKRVHTNRIRTIDITPTILELAGIPGPATGIFDGSSIASVVRGQTALSEDRPAVVQVHTADSREFVEYQRRQLNGEPVGTLRHVMLGEVGYLNRHRVVRRHFRYTDTFDLAPVNDTTVEWLDDRLVPQPDRTTDPDALLAMLADYDSARRPTAEVPATDGIRRELRSLGYPI